MHFECVEADEALLGRIWEKNIAANPGDERWPRWRDEYLANHAEGRSRTFLVLADGDEIVAGCGLITNDFISRMDLSPWLAALYVEEKFRGCGLGGRLVLHTMEKVTRLGLDSLYLCTDHVGYYEQFGFEAIAVGYHPWGESSRIYRARTQI